MPRSSFLKSFVVAGILALGAQAADAASYTFSFGDGVSTQTVSGLALSSITGATFDSTTKAITAGGNLTTGTGLGLDLLTDGRLNGPSTGTAREMLQFVFGRAVHLVSVTLSDIAVIAHPRLAVFVGSTYQSGLDPIAASPTTNVSAGLFQGTSFGIGARADTSFYITSITVDDEVTAAVPLPAGGLLLGSLVVVPFLRRKRRA